MARRKGSFNMSSNVEPRVAAPFDARQVVPTKDDLVDATNFPYAYIGMIVSVQDEGRAYILRASDTTNPNSWQEIGSGGGGGVTYTAGEGIDISASNVISSTVEQIDSLQDIFDNNADQEVTTTETPQIGLTRDDKKMSVASDSFAFVDTTVQTGPRLPEGYQEVAYIESSGTQYIDTGFTPNQDTRIVADFQYMATNLRQGYRFTGSESVAPRERGFRFGSHATGTWLSAYGSSGLVNSGTCDNERHTLDFNKNIVKLDNALLHEYTYSSFNGYGSIYIFSINCQTIQDLTPARLYAYRLYDNGTLIRNYVPCYREADETVGLYDLVNNNFVTNSGTGTFEKGGDITPSSATLKFDPFSADGEETLVLDSKNLSSWRRVLGITGGNEVVAIDDELSDTSENPVQNKVITDAISNLATQTYVDDKIVEELGQFDKLDYTIVTTLPTTGEAGVRYLVKDATEDKYTEWIYVDDAWANIGSTDSIDLTDYYNKTQVDDLLDDKADAATTYTKDETDLLLSNKQNTLTAGDNITIDPATNTISATGGGTSTTSTLDEVLAAGNFAKSKVISLRGDAGTISGEYTNLSKNQISVNNLDTNNVFSIIPGQAYVRNADDTVYLRGGDIEFKDSNNTTTKLSLNVANNTFSVANETLKTAIKTGLGISDTTYSAGDGLSLSGTTFSTDDATDEEIDIMLDNIFGGA